MVWTGPSRHGTTRLANIDGGLNCRLIVCFCRWRNFYGWNLTNPEQYLAGGKVRERARAEQCRGWRDLILPEQWSQALVSLGMTAAVLRGDPGGDGAVRVPQLPDQVQHQLHRHHPGATAGRGCRALQGAACCLSSLPAGCSGTARGTSSSSPPSSRAQAAPRCAEGSRCAS